MKISIIDNDGKLQIKIQDTNFELNIKNLIVENIVTLSNIYSTDWVARKTIEAGISAGATVFWACDEEKNHVCILVGEDDELWNFGIVIDCDYFLQEINRFIYDKPILF